MPALDKLEVLGLPDDLVCSDLFAISRTGGVAMNIMWFGDNPDLMKWTLVRQILKANGANLVYIPYLNENSEVTGRIKDVVDPGVWEYFKSIERLIGLLKVVSHKPKVVWQGFDHSARDTYLRRVVDVVRQRDAGPVVVFFDPDTGIEKGHLGPHHASNRELKTVWEQIKPGDSVLLYQHAWMERTWQRTAQKLLDQALGYRGTQVLSLPLVTKSAVLLYAVKG